MLEKLKNTILNAPIVRSGEKFDIYPPFGSLRIEPQVVEEVTNHILKIANLNCDKIAAVESTGVAIATALSLSTKIPLAIIRKKSYGFKDEFAVSNITGYTRNKYYVNGITKGMKVFLFDDVINTGETMKAIVKTLEYIGAEITDIVFVMDKGKDREKVAKELKRDIKALVKVDISTGKARILEELT